VRRLYTLTHLLREFRKKLANDIVRCEAVGIFGFGTTRKERGTLMCSVGGKPTEVKVRNLVAWIAGKRETKSLAIDKAIFRMVSKSS
jgi:hypothetical protein